MASTSSGNGPVVRGILFFAGFLGYLVPMILPVMVRDIAADLQASITSIGLLIGMQSVAVAVASLFVGPISDRYGSKNVLTLFLILNGAALCLFSQVRSIGEFYVSGILCAVMFSPLVLCAFAYIGDHFEAKDRGGVVGLVSGALYGAVAIGVPITVALMERPAFGWRMVFVTFGIFSIAAGIVSLGSLMRNQREPSGSVTVRGIVIKYLSFLREPKLFGFLLIFFVVRVGVGMYFTYGAAYLLLSRSFPPSGFSLIYPIGAVCAFLASIYAGKIKDKVSSKLVIVLSSVSIVASIILIVSYPTTPGNIVLVMGIISTAYMMSESFRMATLNAEAVSRVEPASRGAFLGAVNFLIYIGTALGVLIGGGMLDFVQNGSSKAEQLQIGYTYIVYLTALLWLAAALLSLFVIGQKATSRPSGLAQAKS